MQTYNVTSDEKVFFFFFQLCNIKEKGYSKENNGQK